MTTTHIPALSTAARWSVADTLTIVGRHLSHLRRQPVRLVANLLFPIITVLLFGYVFGSAITLPGNGNYREYLMPGLFVMTMALGTATTVISVAIDSQRGVNDRLRTIPLSRSAIVTGRCLADVVTGSIELASLMVCGYVVGWRARGSILDTIVAIALLLLLRFALAWVGVYVGLIVASPEAATPALAPIYPLTMISNAFVDPTQMPNWLGWVAEWNPISATIAATRELFGNPTVGASASWPVEHSLILSVLWPVVLVTVFLPLSAKRFQDLKP